MDRKDLKKAAYAVVALILVLVILYSGLRILESTVFYKPDEEQPGDSKWIYRDGVGYYPRQDITVVLLMGIDRMGTITGGEEDRNHAADVFSLLILDEQKQEVSILLLNRDTMVMMEGLDKDGTPNGTKYYSQLALSHGFGTGREDSCDNARKTVSQLLYGIQIDYYVSMNMGGISVLNDAVGGVTVNVKDDFSKIDPTIGMGEVKLNGEQAVNFIRTRKGLGDQLNISRMERHKEYFNGLLAAFKEQKAQSDTFGVSAYEQISPYIVTDCSSNVLSSMLDRYAEYTLKEVVSPEGENTRGEKYMEFYLDEEALDALILRLFYAPKEK